MLHTVHLHNTKISHFHENQVQKPQVSEKLLSSLKT